MVDMTFVHRLATAISSVLSREETRTFFHEPIGEPINIDFISRKIAQELYFDLDSSVLMDLAMYKYCDRSR
jgi:hypothetical protein